MIELQEDEVDDHDTSTIDEVSFAANLSVASCLKMPKTKQPNKQANRKATNKQATKNMETRSKNQAAKKHSKPSQTKKNAKLHGKPTNQTKRVQKTRETRPNNINTNTWQTKPNKQTA